MRLRVTLTLRKGLSHEPIPTDQSIYTEHNLSYIALIEKTGYI
jgi:hypothetical protein